VDTPLQPDIVTERLRLAWMSPRFIEASLDGRLEEAQSSLGIYLPDGWPDADVRRRLVMRFEQMRSTPADAEWLLRAIVRSHDNGLVGVINFHGAPDERGRAELGYTVFEPFRRRGYASEAALGMMQWARKAHGVRTFVLSISPANLPSLSLAAKLSFVQVGSQIDEEDGEEWVFELSVDSRQPCL
jgi:RimJ/RimL family protein N-acetyltransferase